MSGEDPQSDDSQSGDPRAETPPADTPLVDRSPAADGPLADADCVGVIEGRPDHTDRHSTMCYRENCRTCGAEVEVPVPSPETTAMAQQCRECGTTNWFRIVEVRIPGP